jgi:hypothetical protein
VLHRLLLSHEFERRLARLRWIEVFAFLFVMLLNVGIVSHGFGSFPICDNLDPRKACASNGK